MTRALLLALAGALLGGCAIDAAIVTAAGGTYVNSSAYQSAPRYVDPHDGTGMRSRALAFQACGEKDNSSWDVLDACMAGKGYPVKGR